MLCVGGYDSPVVIAVDSCDVMDGLSEYMGGGSVILRYTSQ
jgi:hypothetical protein